MKGVARWGATCMLCPWSEELPSRQAAETAKRAHEQSTGHLGVAVHGITEGDETDRRQASDELPEGD
jgi:hypothetical protein